MIYISSVVGYSVRGRDWLKNLEVLFLVIANFISHFSYSVYQNYVILNLASSG